MAKKKAAATPAQTETVPVAEAAVDVDALLAEPLPGGRVEPVADPTEELAQATRPKNKADSGLPTTDIKSPEEQEREARPKIKRTPHVVVADFRGRRYGPFEVSASCRGEAIQTALDGPSGSALRSIRYKARFRAWPLGENSNR